MKAIKNLHHAKRFSIIPLPSNTKQELWQYMSLPDTLCDAEIIHTSQKLIDDFLKRLEERHKENINDTLSCLNFVNKEIEEEIRIKSKDFITEIQRISHDGFEFIFDNLKDFHNNPLAFDINKFGICKKNCEEVLSLGKSKIEDYYDFLEKSEIERSEKLKMVLKEKYLQSVKTAFKNASEIQLHFEEQILHINQMLLSNFRLYKELKVHLMTVFSNEVKLMLYKITHLEGIWKNEVKAQIIERLKQFNLNASDINEVLFKDKSIKSIIDLFNGKTDEFIASFVADSIKKDDSAAKEWFEKTQLILNDLDSAANQLIDLYQINAQKLYSNFYVDSETKLQKILTLKIACDKEIQEFHQLMIPEMNTIESGMKSKIDNLHQYWNNTINSISKSMYFKYKFLEDLENIMDKHKKRISTLKCLVEKELHNLFTQHSKLLQGQEELELNILLDTLRKEADNEKLDKTLKMVHETLDKIKSIIGKHKDDELKIISKYYGFCQSDNNVIKEDFKLFVHKNSKEIPVCIHSDLEDAANSPLYQQLKACALKVNDVDLWKSMVIKNIDALLATCEVQQENNALLWFSKEEEKILMNYNQKIQFHNKRHERIKTEIYDVRLAEINYHKERFELHKAGVEKYISTLQDKQKKFMEDHEPYRQEFCKKMEATETGLQSVSTFQEMNDQLEKSRSITNTTLNEISSKFKAFAKEIKNEVDIIYSSNFAYLNNIKLFQEGGNFSSTEAKHFASKILSLHNYIKKNTENLTLKSTYYEKNLVSQVYQATVRCEEKTNDGRKLLEFKNKIDEEYAEIQNALKKEYIITAQKKKNFDFIYKQAIQLIKYDNKFIDLEANHKFIEKLIDESLKYKAHIQDVNDPPIVRMYYQPKESMQVSARSSTRSLSSRKSLISAKKKGKTSRPKISELSVFNLFNQIIPEDLEIDKFLHKIRLKLQKSLNNMIKLAQKTYSTTDPDVCETFDISRTLNDFMCGVCCKFKYYYLQCLQAWIIELFEFINQMDLVQKVVKRYVNNYLKFLHDAEIKALEEKHLEYYPEAKNIVNSRFESINQVSSKLKALHGYPGNAHLLKELKSEMEHVLKIARNKFNQIVVPAKDYTDGLLDAYNKKIAEAKSTCEDILFLLPDPKFTAELQTQMNNIVKLTNSENFPINLNDCTLPVLVKYDKKKSEEEFMDISYPLLDELEEDLSQTYQMVLNEKIQEFVELEEDFNVRLTKCETLWHDNIHMVLQLYKFKYE